MDRQPHPFWAERGPSVHYFNDLLSLRPEVRYERAYRSGATPYDSGHTRNQTSLSIDSILRF